MKTAQRIAKGLLFFGTGVCIILGAVIGIAFTSVSLDLEPMVQTIVSWLFVVVGIAWCIYFTSKAMMLFRPDKEHYAEHQK